MPDAGDDRKPLARIRSRSTSCSAKRWRPVRSTTRKASRGCGPTPRLITGLDLHATNGTPKAVAFAMSIAPVFAISPGSLLATIVAMIAAWSGGRFILRRVDALVDGTRRLHPRARHARCRARCKSELDLLAPAFNTMATDVAGAESGTFVSRRKKPQGGSRARGNACAHGIRQADPSDRCCRKTAGMGCVR